MKFTTPFPPVQWHCYAKFCVAGFLSLLSVAVLADGVPDELQRADNQTAGEMGPAGTLRTVGAYPFHLRGFTVTALADGKVLVYGTDPIGPHVNLAKEASTLRNQRGRAYSGAATDPVMWDPLQRGWEKIPLAPECSFQRFLHSATALPNGKVLIAGGLCDVPRSSNDNTPFTPHTQLSLWDGATKKWETAPSLAVGRLYHSASLMKDGSVVIVGGESDPILGGAGEAVLNSVERYREGGVEELAPLNIARARHTATALADGSLLVTGGFDKDGKAMASVELWDPAKQVWRAAPPLTTPRYHHSATLLQDGRVMIAGGFNQEGESVAATELWDPAKKAWSRGAPLLLPLQGHSAVLLNNGDVLVMGGLTINAAPAHTAMLWDHTREQWRPAGFTMPNAMDDQESHTVTLVPRADGSVHGFGSRWITQWAPAKKTSAAVPLYAARDNHSVTLLRDGRILLAGGNKGNAFLDWAEIYNPVSGRFTATGRMQQARHSHSAVALDDGRVVVAGGWTRTADKPTEPAANSPEVWDPVTGRWSLIKSIRFEWRDWVHLGTLADGRVMFFASRELAEGVPHGPVEYRAWVWNPRNNRVDSMQPRTAPHSKAAISILPDGRVLRVGGNIRSYVPEYRCPPVQRAANAAAEEEREACQNEPAHWQENSDPTAEVWNSHTGGITTLDAPPKVNAANLKSLLLRNGNVLMVDYTPPHPYQTLRSAPVLLWNAQTGKWRTLPPLPYESGWPVTELKDGTLMTNTRWLSPGAESWTTAAAYPQYAWPNASKISSSILQLASGELLALSTSRPNVAVFDEKSKDWKLRANNYLLRGNGNRHALFTLADGRLLISGMAEGRTGLQPTVQIWNPKDNTWTVSANLAGSYGGTIQLAQLPSGRVLHVGMDGQRNLVCEIWQPGDDTWKVCGYIQSKDKPIPEFYLGPVEDGRVALMIGNAEVHVFDDDFEDWEPMKMEWSKTGLSYGAPIRVGGPLARIYDPAAKKWLDASSLASRYLENNNPVSTALSLLWNPGKNEFLYIFPRTANGIGKQAVLLPDGCALSAFPLSVFNPATGKVTPLAEPVIGTPAEARSIALLPDGTVVIAGYPAGTAGDGDGFFYRKATCAGFERLPGDDAFMPGVLAGATAVSAPSATPGVTPVVAQTSWWTRLRNTLAEYSVQGLIIFGALVLYLLLRYGLMPLIQRSRIIDPERKVPKPVAWVMRVVGYSVAAVIIVPMLWSYLQFRQIQIAQECADDASLCLDKETGLLKSVPSLVDAQSPATSQPAIPCRFVGVWSSRQSGSSMYRITLNDTGRYSVEENRDGIQVRIIDTGYWVVQNNHMVWKADRRGTGELDINPILPESDARFVLVEGNGKHTQFELISAIKSSRCTQ